MLDEVRLYERALPPAEIALLASRDGASSWQNAALSRPASLASAWSYALPADIEGYYLVHARASDDAANLGEQATAWRGIIDTKPPVLNATAAFYGGGQITVLLDSTVKGTAACGLQEHRVRIDSPAGKEQSVYLRASGLQVMAYAVDKP